jgi:hypothetical protein
LADLGYEKLTQRNVINPESGYYYSGNGINARKVFVRVLP